MGPEVLLLFALLTLAAPQDPPPKQTYDGKLSKVFTLHFENDSVPNGRLDDSYTQGMELHVRMNRKPWKLLPLDWAGWHLEEGDPAKSAVNFAIGQTIFTPANVITYFPRADDRPFGSFIYVGTESIRVRASAKPLRSGKVLRPRRLIFGVTVGMFGPHALGRDAQSAFHVLREGRMAKGWLESKSRDSPEINFRLANEDIVFQRGSVVDLTVMEEGVLGSTQTYAGVGATVRLGRGLSGLPGLPISIRVDPEEKPKDRDPFEISARIGGRVRGMWHNAFVSGPWRGPSNGLEAEHILKEWHFGGEVRVHEWRFSYLVITQDREIRNQAAELPAKHRFVAFNLSREGEAWGLPCECFRKVAAGSRFNIRLGRASTSITPDGPVDHKPSLGASWGVEHALPGNLSIAWEKTGATREGGKPVGVDEHTDQFLLAKAFTLGWETSSTTSRHKLQVRAGGGPALAKYQVTEDIGALFEPEPVDTIEKGWSWLAGVRYSVRVGEPVSITLDAAHGHLYINRERVTRADFTTFTIGLQIHPWHRDSGK